MNHELFSNMQKQMTPSPEVRAALSEKLACPAKKRPVPWIKYVAVAACAALVIGALSVYGLYQDQEKWMLITRNFHHDDIAQQLHSYVTVEGLTGYATEDAAVIDKGSGEENYLTGIIDRIDRSEESYTGAILDRTQSPNTGGLPNWDTAPSGALPGGAYVGDAPVQEGAEDYQKLMDHFNGTLPDWYGGAYLNSAGWLVVQLVESEDPGDKSLELQVLDWTGSGNVMFSSCKYSLSYLRDLQDKACGAMIELGLFSSCGADEERNRLDLALTSVTDEALALLAGLDPDDDAIYVQVGKLASAQDAVREGEDPAVHHVIRPGGTTVPVPDDEDLIADEPVYDGAHYDVEHLPEELPEEKRPAATVDSVPEEDVSTSSWFRD